MSTPTDEELNVTICEWAGFTIREVCRNPNRIVWDVLAPDGSRRGDFGGPLDWVPSLTDAIIYLPNHITGREALYWCHEAEKKLDDSQIDRYKNHLCVLITHPEERISQCATPRTRALALCHVIKPELFH